MEGTIKLPLLGPTKKEHVYIGGALVVGIVGYAYWSRRSIEQAEAATVDDGTVRPSTADGTDSYIPPGGSLGVGGSTVGGGDAVVLPPITNAEWTTRAVNAMVGIGYDPTFVSTVLGQVLARQPVADAASRDAWNTAVGLMGPPPQGTYSVTVAATPPTTTNPPPTTTNPPPTSPGQDTPSISGYKGPARRKPYPKASWVKGNPGWIKPSHTNFEAELIHHYTNVAPPGTGRALQVQKLRTRNAAHGGVTGRPTQPAIYLPETL